MLTLCYSILDPILYVDVSLRQKFNPSRHQDVATDWYCGDSVSASNPVIFLIDERKLLANGFQGGHPGLCKSQ